MKRYFSHSAEGTTWAKKDHKYVRKEGKKYIYPEDLQREEVDELIVDQQKVTKKGSKKKDIRVESMISEDKDSMKVDHKDNALTEQTNGSGSSRQTRSSGGRRSYATSIGDKGLTIKMMTKLYGRPKNVDSGSLTNDKSISENSNKNASNKKESNSYDVTKKRVSELDKNLLRKSKSIVEYMLYAKK